MKAGQAVPVPPFIASASFDMDLESGPYPKMIGSIAVLLEEDSTPNSSIILGRIAYSKEIEKTVERLDFETNSKRGYQSSHCRRNQRRQGCGQNPRSRMRSRAISLSGAY